MTKLLLSCLLFLSCIHLVAQESKTISGTVSDSSTGETLIGVIVAEKGGLATTTTDLDGKYTLQIKGDKLIFSYVGYTAREMTVTQSGVQDIKLVSDNELDEVVVVGYTSMKKRDILGSIGKVGSDKLVQLPVAGASEALQGRVAGVNVTTTSGAPGAGVTVRVRGTGSINSSNDPLYIIDGIPAEGGLGSIAPSDIESISVLKDASSAAIYGSRATNGVVLVTTKKGIAGKPKVQYNGQFGVQTHPNLPRMVSTAQYIDIYNVAATADGRPLIEGDYLKPDFANTDHLSEIFRTALLNVHELSVTGGSKKFNYLVSSVYYDQQGIIENSDYNKFSGRANLSYKTADWITIGVNINGGRATTHGVPSSGDGYQNSEGGSVVRYAYMRNPAIPVYDKNGKFVDLPSEYFGNAAYDSFFGNGYNPVGLAKMSDRVRKDDSFLGKIYAEVKLPYNIMWNTNFGIDYLKSNFDINNQTWGTNGRINNPSSSSNEYSRSTGWTFNSILNNVYKIDDDNNLNTMIGTEAIRYNGVNKSTSSSINGNTFNSSMWAYSLLSFFAKADYNYRNRYYLSGLVRQDGSSRFTKGNQWGTFYSLSGGWDVHEEDFMKPIKYINLLKLRAGWGAVGNQNVGLYAYTDTYKPFYNYPFENVPSTGMAQVKLGNKDLKWETSKQLNLGIDMSFAKGEYGFSVDYYNKQSENMLVKAPLPPSIGYADPYWINAGTVLNRGVDIEVYYRKQYKDFGFSATMNWGFLKNQILKLDAPIQAGRVDNGIFAKLLEEGHSVGSFYMYEMDGIFQNQDEIVRSAYQGTNIKPGDVKYKDIHPDGVIDEKDRTHIGSSLPKQTMGLNLQGNYKNWDVALFFQGAFGHSIYYQIAQETEGFYRGFNVSANYYENYWRGEGTSNEYPRPSWSAKSNNVMVSSRFLQDASYVRLKNIQIGYTFPIKSKYISQLRAYGSATNLLTFTGYKGIDPEMTVSANSASEGDVSNGIDWGTYPAAKALTLGVNITF